MLRTAPARLLFNQNFIDTSTPMLKDKFGIIFGVANKRSIAWATAQSLHEAGARLAFTYQGDRLKENVEGLTTEAMPGSLLLPCDVTKQEEVDATFKRVGEEFGRLDFLIHSIAYAPREALGGEYLDTSREAFLTALEISAYSLVQLARAATPLMTEGGSIVCMTYYGAEKVVAGYNVMGVAKAALEASTRYLANDLGPRNIRVNAISAGPDSNPFRARRRRLQFNVEARGRARPAPSQCRSARSWQHCSLPLQLDGVGNHRRSYSRRLRLQHHGDMSDGR